MAPKKQLSLFDLSMIVISLVIGMGIFKTPVRVASAAQIPELFFLAWIIGGLVALCGALTYAEIGSRFPVTGGYYKVFSAFYHPSIAFAINCIIIVSNAGSVAAVSLIGAEYLSKVILPLDMQTEFYRIIIAAITIVLFYIVNLLGLKVSAKAQNVLSVIKMGMVLTLIGAVFAGPAAVSQTPVFETGIAGAVPAWSDYGKALGICLIAISFTFGGYQQTINFGGETKNPNKVVPRAIIIGLAIIIALYMAINYAYVRVIGFEQLKTAESIAAILAGKIFGPAGFTLLSGLIYLSVLGYVNVNLLSNPRAMYAMGEEKALPSLFTRISKRTDVMYVSLTVFAVIAVFTLFYAQTFEKILNYTIFLDCIGMATSAATLFFLRKRTADLDKKTIYSMRLYPLLPLIFIAAYLFVALSIYSDDPKAAINGLIIFAGFIVIYFISVFFNKNKQTG
ncbi:APC family permease [Pedobacter metabolipauper]|uniref:APA family basic amino acid/polyamine antiporter n=1 Tax=Pedobacter metabolipauper TaxID=425513 RepID=A0A4R6STR3_9SPHI|nr:amino acid permease [Pedobacter metabolipauper]TDQ08767.1 APA family basic amino acid/polyamine antiporter [Pedobacter metabolipauper]